MVTGLFRVWQQQNAIMKKQSNRMTAQRTGLILAFTLGLGVFASENSYAIGFLVPNQDAEAIARGNAFAATADNPSAIFYNPAGISQLKGQNIDFLSGLDYTRRLAWVSNGRKIPASVRWPLIHTCNISP